MTKENSKLSIETLARDYLWKNYISNPLEKSGYYLALTDGVNARKGDISSSYLFQSNCPPLFTELTWGELYEYNNWYVDAHCATCKFWKRYEKQNKGYCSILEKDTDFCDYQDCEKYQRKYEYFNPEILEKKPEDFFKTLDDGTIIVGVEELD